MAYPVYKLLRAVNRQYPNNGFINYVDVTEDTYNNEMIDEDLRDLLNETLQEVYIDIALDEVYSFPTVAGQNQYQLPDDCDLRDIQEVTRTYAFRPLRPPCGGPVPTEFINTLYFDANGGTGDMEPVEGNVGDVINLPMCEFEPPEGKSFVAWEINGELYQPGDSYEMQGDFIATAIWDNFTIRIYVSTPGGTGTLHYRAVDDVDESYMAISYGDEGFVFTIPRGASIGSIYPVLEMYDDYDEVKLTDFTGITPTEDMNIPVAVPIVNEVPGDGNNGGQDNPLE